jgi:hypothetical protein
LVTPPGMGGNNKHVKRRYELDEEATLATVSIRRALAAGDPELVSHDLSITWVIKECRYYLQYTRRRWNLACYNLATLLGRVSPREKRGSNNKSAPAGAQSLSHSQHKHLRWTTL